MKRHLSDNAVVSLIVIALTSPILVGLVGTAVSTEHREQEKAVAIEQQVQELVQLNAQLREEVSQLREQVELERMEYMSCGLTWNFDYVAQVVAEEARGEPFEGQMAVAQTIRDRANAWGLTPEEVVRQVNQYAVPVAGREVSDSVREACERVLINGESVVDGPIYSFYSTMGGFRSAGHEKMEFVVEIGHHRFFR